MSDAPSTPCPRCGGINGHTSPCVTYAGLVDEHGNPLTLAAVARANAHLFSSEGVPHVGGDEAALPSFGRPTQVEATPEAFRRMGIDVTTRGTVTGRFSSSEPNLQNIHPRVTSGARARITIDGREVGLANGYSMGATLPRPVDPPNATATAERVVIPEGSPLRVESLETTLRNVTFDAAHLRPFAAYPGTVASEVARGTLDLIGEAERRLFDGVHSIDELRVQHGLPPLPDGVGSVIFGTGTTGYHTDYRPRTPGYVNAYEHDFTWAEARNLNATVTAERNERRYPDGVPVHEAEREKRGEFPDRPAGAFRKTEFRRSPLAAVGGRCVYCGGDTVCEVPSRVYDGYRDDRERDANGWFQDSPGHQGAAVSVQGFLTHMVCHAEHRAGFYGVDDTAFTGANGEGRRDRTLRALQEALNAGSATPQYGPRERP